MSSSSFPPNSRYVNVGTTTYRPPEEGRDPIVHLRRRLLPDPERFDTIAVHPVAAGDRPDTLAASVLGDAEQAWRLADANGAMRPDELTAVPGRLVRITLPEGVRGSPHAR